MFERGYLSVGSELFFYIVCFINRLNYEIEIFYQRWMKLNTTELDVLNKGKPDI